MRSRLRKIVPAGALALACAVAAAFPAAAAELPAARSSERGVTVAVTPQQLSPSAASWDFKVVLDTHSQDLSDDLLKSAVLLDGKGGKHSPVSWKGAGPGGHHRQGVLGFRPLGAGVRAVELQIQRAGEPSPRTFRWQLE
jgi:hypothetical protein